MSISRQTVDQYLYEFDQGYQVTYVNYSRANELTDSQLVLTLERGCERKPLPLPSHISLMWIRI